MEDGEGVRGGPETDLAAALGRFAGRRTAVLCVGNALRGDDAFGPTVAALLQDDFAEFVFDGRAAPENELPRIARLAPEVVIIVDAVDFGASVGALAVLDPHRLRVGGFDTHTVSLSAAVEFLEAACGADVVLLACQPRGLEIGDGISQEVENAAERAAGVLRKQLG